MSNRYDYERLAQVIVHTKWDGITQQASFDSFEWKGPTFALLPVSDTLLNFEPTFLDNLPWPVKEIERSFERRVVYYARTDGLRVFTAGWYLLSYKLNTFWWHKVLAPIFHFAWDHNLAYTEPGYIPSWKDFFKRDPKR